MQNAIATTTTVELLRITPAMAEEMLEHNTNNRGGKEGKIKEMARDMLADNWKLTWDAIAFDYDGNLVNGQHRLKAQVRSGTTQEYIVVRNLDPPSILVGDRGTIRQISHIFEMRGEKNATGLAALIRGIWIYETTGKPRTGGGNSGRNFPPQVAINVLDRHPAARAYVKTERPIGFLVPSQNNLLRYLLNHVDPRDAEMFFQRIEIGANLNEDDPCLLLRNRLAAEEKKTGGKITEEHAVMLTVMAWNAFRNGEARRILRYRAGDNYPWIDGMGRNDAGLPRFSRLT